MRIKLFVRHNDGRFGVLGDIKVKSVPRVGERLSLTDMRGGGVTVDVYVVIEVEHALSLYRPDGLIIDDDHEVILVVSPASEQA